MKRKELISGLSFILPLLLSISSFAQDIVCIDPGHGGPGARKILDKIDCYNYSFTDSVQISNPIPGGEYE